MTCTYIAHEDLPFQHCNHVIDCSVRCTIGTRDHDATVHYEVYNPDGQIGTPSYTTAPSLGIYMSSRLWPDPSMNAAQSSFMGCMCNSHSAGLLS